MVYLFEPQLCGSYVLCQLKPKPHSGVFKVKSPDRFGQTEKQAYALEDEQKSPDKCRYSLECMVV